MKILKGIHGTNVSVLCESDGLKTSLSDVITIKNDV